MQAYCNGRTSNGQAVAACRTNPTAGTGLLPQGSQADLLQESHPACIWMSIAAALAAACMYDIVLSLVKIPSSEALSVFGARSVGVGWAGSVRPVAGRP